MAVVFVVVVVDGGNGCNESTFVYSVNMRDDNAFHMDIVSDPMVRWACPTRVEEEEEDGVFPAAADMSAVILVDAEVVVLVVVVVVVVVVVAAATKAAVPAADELHDAFISE